MCEHRLDEMPEWTRSLPEAEGEKWRKANALGAVFMDCTNRQDVYDTSLRLSFNFDKPDFSFGLKKPMKYIAAFTECGRCLLFDGHLFIEIHSMKPRCSMDDPAVSKRYPYIDYNPEQLKAIVNNNIDMRKDLMMKEMETQGMSWERIDLEMKVLESHRNTHLEQLKDLDCITVTMGLLNRAPFSLADKDKS